jgi:hypothetical protein
MNIVHNLGDSERYTPPLEPFRSHKIKLTQQ